MLLKASESTLNGDHCLFFEIGTDFFSSYPQVCVSDTCYCVLDQKTFTPAIADVVLTLNFNEAFRVLPLSLTGI